MDPFTIATTVTKITTTCLTTGKAIYDLSCKYKDAPMNMVTISSEVAVISASLSQLQALILSQKSPEKLLRSRPEVAATLDTSLTGCMVLFSCLDDEVREVSRHGRGLGGLSWRGKVKTVWKQAKFQELLDAIRGQQVAINTLMQLLQMDSLAEITQLLQQAAPELRKTIERTASLRISHPSVKVAESIYSLEDRGSVYSAADSLMASSELEFDFDDIIVNSAAYRRALAAARHQRSSPSPQPGEEDSDLIDFSDSNTIQQLPIEEASADLQAISQDLFGIRFSVAMGEPTLGSEMNTEVPLDRDRNDNGESRLVETSALQGHPNVETGPSGQPPAIASVHSRSTNTTPEPQARTPRDELDFTLSSEVLEGQSPPSSTHLSTTSRSSARSTGRQFRTSLSSPAKSPNEPDTRLQNRVCHKCNEPLSGRFVRALGTTYHLECFTCVDCEKVVATNFFPFPDKPPHQYPLCERDYFRRLDLLCFSCGEALRGSYTTALDRKYHLGHFRCGESSCSTVFGPQDSYYEHGGDVYCLDHYASSRAKPCNGCTLPILKQFVEIFRNGKEQVWHPECYKVHKYWNVRMATLITISNTGGCWKDEDGRMLDSAALAHQLQSAESAVTRVWSILSTYEERAATTISDVLLHASNEPLLAIPATALMMSTFGVILRALESIDHRRLLRDLANMKYAREAKLLCKKTVVLMQYMAESIDRAEPRKGVTEELLTLVTGLAHYCKLLIRIALLGCCDSIGEFLEPFLKDMDSADLEYDLHYYRSRTSLLISSSNDTCMRCDKAVEDACFQRGSEPMELWHRPCLFCSSCYRSHAFVAGSTSTGHDLPLAVCHFCGAPRDKDMVAVPLLTQYVRLLWIGHARLMATVGYDPANLMDVSLDHARAKDRAKTTDSLESVDDQQDTSAVRLVEDHGAGGSPTIRVTNGAQENITLQDIPRIVQATRLQVQPQAMEFFFHKSQHTDLPDPRYTQRPQHRH